MLKRDQESFLRTIAAIDAAGFDEELWPHALSCISELFGSVGATLEAADKSLMRLTDFWGHGIPAGSDIAYSEHFMSISPRVQLGFRSAIDEIGYDSLVIDEDAMNSDAYYNDFLLQADLRYFVSGTMIQNPSEFACVALQRSPREGHVQQSEIDTMARLTPHVRQAYDVTRRLRAATQTARSLERALDWLNEGALLVGTDGKVIYANDAARNFARRGDGFHIRRGMLDFPSAEARAVFDTALAAAGTRQSAARVPLDFPLTRTGGAPPYICSIRPVSVPERRFDHTPAVAVVFIRDPLRQGDGHTADIARQAFGLTEAEANLAAALQAGTSLGEYARTRRLSPNTVYTHLRRIKEKTGARRIADLALKLAELAPPLKGSE
jgi:DNA-binding CsgD family transcriptional regulator